MTGDKKNPLSNSSKSRKWSIIMKLGTDLQKIDINLFSEFKNRIRDYACTLLWKDIWIGGSPLKDYYKSLYFLETEKNYRVKEICFFLDPPLVAEATSTNQQHVPTLF